MASSTFYKFNQFVGDLGVKLHDLDTDELKILLTNTAPNAADTHIDTSTTPCEIHATSGAVEIAAGNGYTKGGEIVSTNVYAQSSGVGKLYGVKVTFTATGAIPTFRYAVLYNNTGGAAATRLPIGWWDYGVGGVTLGNGETFIVGNSNDGTDWTTTYPILTVT